MQKNIIQKDMFKQSLSRRNMLKALGIAGLAGIAAKTLTPFALAQDTTMDAAALTQPVGYYPFAVGDFRAVVLSDGSANLPYGWFGANADPAELQQLLADNFIVPDANETIKAQIKPLLVNTGSEVVLFDTGYGVTGQGQGTGRLLETMTAANVEIEDITAVIISHAHFDHIAGLLNANGQLIFPNARYYIPEAEWMFWIESEAPLPGFPEDFAAQVRAAPKQIFPALQDRMELFKADAEVVSGIQAVPVPGHTPGMSAFQISSGSQSLLYTADAMNHHLTALAHPEWAFASDTDPAVAAETRVNLLDRIVTDKQLIMAYHFPFPGLGHIAKRSEGYEYVPAEWNF